MTEKRNTWGFFFFSGRGSRLLFVFVCGRGGQKGFRFFGSLRERDNNTRTRRKKVCVCVVEKKRRKVKEEEGEEVQRRGREGRLSN